VSATESTLRRQTSSKMVYDRRGEGPTVVLLHGWALNGRLWMYLEERLVPGHETVTPDFPGFGRSDGLGGPYDVARHAGAVCELLVEADLRDAVLVGFAYGAAVAMRAALADDARISGLVLVGTPRAGHLPVDRMVQSMRRDWPSYARRSAEALCKGQSEATVRWMESMFAATRLPVAIETWIDISTFDPAPLVEDLAVPSLFLHGEHDEFSPLAVAEECAARARNSRVAVAAGANHLVPIDAPEWTHEQILAFVAEVTGS
jgi:pimeloyl-ACP methyl ester carboxylesterase